jgi:nickel/cobalt transporter (NicO) family protein
MQGVMRALLALIVLLLLPLQLPQAAAQTTSQPVAEQAAPPVTIDRKKLLVQPRNKDGTLEQVSFFDDPVLWAREKQQAFYGKLSATLRQMKGSSPWPPPGR